MKLQQLFQAAMDAVRGIFQPKQQELLSPIPQGTVLGSATPPPSATPVPQNRLSPVEQRRQELLAGFGRYGATPSAQAVDVMATAPDRYEVFAKNPYLLPALSIVETSAGQNMTRPKHIENPQNLMNWGIAPSLGFNPQTQQESVERALTGIGERSPYYQPFRESGNLEDFVEVYAPESDGNAGYLDKLLRAQQYFQN